MEWTKPTIIEISLSGEVTAYANMDSAVQPSSEPREPSCPIGDRQNSE